jgi:hypothetical protein
MTTLDTTTILRTIRESLIRQPSISEVVEEDKGKGPHLVFTLAQPIFGRNLQVLLGFQDDGTLRLAVPNLMHLPVHPSFAQVHMLALTVDKGMEGTTVMTPDGQLHYSMLPEDITEGSPQALAPMVETVSGELRKILRAVLGISLARLVQLPAETSMGMIEAIEQAEKPEVEQAPRVAV